MNAIFKKEFKSYFHSVTGWLFLGVFIGFVGIYFTYHNLIVGYPYISYSLGSMQLIYMLLVPILTMRSVSEERKQKTDQLLLTVPIGAFRIVFGKYLALLAILAIGMAVIACFPLVMMLFGTIPVGESYLAILGFFMFAAACLSVGLFMSALTEHQIIAAVLTYTVLVLGLLMPGITGMITTSSNLLTKILNVVNLSAPSEEALNGILNVNDLFYYLSVIVAMLVLTYFAISKRTFNKACGGMKRIIGNTVGVLITIAVIVAANIGVSMIPARYTSYDLTQNQRYTLHDETKALLKSLDEDVTFYILADEAEWDPTIEKYLSLYEDLSKHIKVVYRPVTEYPNFYATYTSTEPSKGSIIVVSNTGSYCIDYNDCYIMEYGYDNTTFQVTTNVTGLDAEGQMTAALQYVLTGESTKLYLVTGHEENGLSESILNALQKMNVTTEQLELIKCDAIPEDADMIAIAGPNSDFSKEDADKIKNYLKEGGKGIFMVAVTENGTPVYDSIFEDMGITVTKGAVMEANGNYCYQYPYILLPEVLSNSITNGIYQKKIMVMPWARALEFDDTEEAEEVDSIQTEKKASITKLLTTSNKGYLKQNLTLDNLTEQNESDRTGCFTVGLYAEQDCENGTTSRVVLLSSANLFADNIDAASSGANGQLFTNAIAELSDHTLNVSVPSVSYSFSNLLVSKNLILMIGLCTVILAPMVLIVAGIVIWAVRRKK